MNTMSDARGDTTASPVSPFYGSWVNRDNDVRGQYAWHGRYPSFTTYDNIGASVWYPPTPTQGLFSDRSDSSGRLTAPQFVGIATIHADRAPNDTTNDLNQPSTTSYEGSDDPLNFLNDQFNTGKMTNEYQWMSRRHRWPRHADQVGPTGDPSLGNSGGQSIANGYGPYTLAAGDSVRIVMVEAVAGLSRERAISIGTRFKNYYKNGITTYPEGITFAQKNDSVYTGRDSLFQTFRRATANYRANYNIPPAPYPPKDFTVTSGGDQVLLTWDTYGGGPTYTGFRIYRATGVYNGTYTKIHNGDLLPTVREFSDTAVTRGAKTFYYIVAVGDPVDNNAPGINPAGVPLVSGRYYTQTYDEATLRRQAGTEMSKIRIVPNPYVASSFADRELSVAGDKVSMRIPGAPDRLAFFNIPGYCTIRIYTELGELIYTIEHNDGSGDAYWNSITSSNQVVASGLYIAVIEDTRTGEIVRKKFVVIR